MVVGGLVRVDGGSEVLWRLEDKLWKGRKELRLFKVLRLALEPFTSLSYEGECV